MKKYGLVSNYTIKQFKIYKSGCNNDKVENVVNTDFQNRSNLDVVVSDLTYVNVAGKWYYICLLINLHNRELISCSVGKNNDVKLVYEAFMREDCNLSNINIFHIDRGNV